MIRITIADTTGVSKCQ